jgi:hypothetical protein
LCLKQSFRDSCESATGLPLQSGGNDGRNLLHSRAAFSTAGSQEMQKSGGTALEKVDFVMKGGRVVKKP